MRILIQLSHPAHYHLFKHTARTLTQHGHTVVVAIKTKDILEDLVRQSGMQYVNLQPKAHRKSRLGVVYDTLLRTARLARLARRQHIDLIMGCSAEVAQVGWLLRCRRFNFGEDDASVIPQLIRLARPFADRYYAPDSCHTGALEPKTIHYAGYHKLAYLHPNRFTPNAETASKYIDIAQPFFLLRFAQLNAYHDIGNHAHGIDTEVAQRLIDLLSPHGRILISSERELEPQFEPYRLHINPLDIHHIMAFATLYIGDSQSMAVEAAMLGTPSIRFNDFAGRIGVLEELEHRYRLTVGIPSDQPQQLYDKVEELIGCKDLKKEFQERRQAMLNDKIDVTAFFVEQIENLKKR